MTTQASSPAPDPDVERCDGPAQSRVSSDIPARIDRLPWSPFHTRMVLALGSCWILDGLEITIARDVGDKLTGADRLGVPATAVGLFATVYLAGQVVGALVFGQLSDRYGRRTLFFVTLAVYFGGSVLTAVTLGSGALSVAWLYLARFVAGAGIGGEYAAINSTIDELVPAPYRGRTNVILNGTYWAGAGIAAAIQIPLLNGPIPQSIDWRVTLVVGPALCLFIILLRKAVPESPRWLLMHGRHNEAKGSIAAIEDTVHRTTGRRPAPVDEWKEIEIRPTRDYGYAKLLRVLFQDSPGRATLGATLMITQSFLFNAIFFSYATVLSHFYLGPDVDTSIYYIPFAVGNLLGPLLLGQFFDTIGRRPMIIGTYLCSGALLMITAFLFRAGALDATTQTIAWCVVFFFASAGASGAYLTVSEIFPLEVRAKAIAVFFAIAQVFGAVAPLIYTVMIGTQDAPSRSGLFWAYVLGAVLMMSGGVVAALLGVAAELKPLEDIATPLSSEVPRRRTTNRPVAGIATVTTTSSTIGS